MIMPKEQKQEECAVTQMRTTLAGKNISAPTKKEFPSDTTSKETPLVWSQHDQVTEKLCTWRICMSTADYMAYTADNDLTDAKSLILSTSVACYMGYICLPHCLLAFWFPKLS